ncbi:MAG TPA: YbhN family protein [Xanthobacteraceae bacterium]|nr:YbhN family protein [Xanthobacteraceae bacterium]
MPDVSDFVAQSVHDRGAWSRIGLAIGLSIVTGAGVALIHILRDVDMSRVFGAVLATPASVIVPAACFVAASYATLTLYDLLSLRVLGIDRVPYRVAALASFCSYSIGHNLGATLLTAGAVRWRIYAPWSLSVADVAKIAFLTSLTFWLGNLTVLGCGMIVLPEAAGALDHLPPFANRLIGILCLLAIAGYLAWMWPQRRRIGGGAWGVTLPGPRLTLAQIAIGVLDLSAGGVALFVLLTAHSDVDFLPVLVIYAAATFIGVLSLAPGSLGVFEAAVLIAMPQLAKDDLLASLLIFRCLYFVVPMILAIAVMGLRELRSAVR